MPRLLLVALLLAAGCSTTDHRHDRVVVGVYPLQWLVAQLVAPGVDVVDVVPRGVEPHDVELSPRQVAQAYDSTVLRLDGFQASLDDIGGEDLWQAGLSPIEHGGVRDPHVWLDPVRMGRLASWTAERLRQLRVPLTDGGLARVQQTLGQLDRDIRTQLVGCRSHDVVTSHAAFGYFAQRYGLVQHGISGLDPSSDPSPRTLARLAVFAKEHHVTTVFSEALLSPKVARTLADEVGAHTAVLDPLESVSKDDDYPGVLRRDARTLHQALGCAA